MRASSFPFLMLVELDRSKHGLVRQYAAVPLTACYLLHLVEEYSTCVGMNRERADGLAGEGSIPHSRGDAERTYGQGE